ncbi:hypothetical protein [uncultured Draconibacterium sp.]|uniref:hypothetical protein n=1 Tax=uncultured Draconibacterium sp. TaxID=1573823 RepID=UPI0029C810D9|nr:hypothetical protein [uncultured Draconibacterium sp.]
MTKRLRNRILIGIAIFLIILGGFVIYLLREVDKASNPDPDFNTVFTEKYDSDRFENIKTGDEIDYVIDVIGEPFKIDTIEFFEQLLYTNSPDDVFFIEGSDGLRFHGGNDSLKYSSISVNENGDIINVFADFEIGGKSKDQLKLLNKAQLIELFGKPQKHMICDCKCIIFSYSKLKEGPYRGKLPVVELRKIMFKENAVIGKVRRDGNPYNPYVGTCEVIKN